MKQTYWPHLKKISVVLLGIGLLYLLVNAIVDFRLRDIAHNLQLQIAEQEAVLATVAETTARNGADAVTESIIRDCPLTERVAFDTLLGRLDAGLSQEELSELDRLFGRCGGFFAERKAVMVARLSREIEVYEDYVHQLGIVVRKDLTEANSLNKWQDLQQAEQNQSELFAELVRLQDQIITALLDGNSQDSSAVRALVQEAHETRGTLVVSSKQASSIRAELISL